MRKLCSRPSAIISTLPAMNPCAKSKAGARIHCGQYWHPFLADKEECTVVMLIENSIYTNCLKWIRKLTARDWEDLRNWVQSGVTWVKSPHLPVTCRVVGSDIWKCSILRPKAKCCLKLHDEWSQERYFSSQNSLRKRLSFLPVRYAAPNVNSGTKIAAVHSRILKLDTITTVVCTDKINTARSHLV